MTKKHKNFKHKNQRGFDSQRSFRYIIAQSAKQWVIQGDEKSAGGVSRIF